MTSRVFLSFLSNLLQNSCTLLFLFSIKSSVSLSIALYSPLRSHSFMLNQKFIKIRNV